MNDSFAPLSITKLYNFIFSDSNNNTILGISKQLLFEPSKSSILSTDIFLRKIDSPIGVAAGPHSQLAQNIIAAWLCGARYIELKTVQTLDELKISKPCIDMQNEGYNCEWSQELKIEQSFNEYLKAWIFIHLISYKLGYGASPNTLFNMSVGYNYEGIRKENVQWFFGKMKDCHLEKDAMIKEVALFYPNILDISIPNTISNNITLSTMHGCPPEEIEKIGKYLIEEKKLHTFIKLNPTLLGKEELHKILNDNLDFKTLVPDEAFVHDLKFDDAIDIIKSLSESAAKNQVFFGVKLTNTLESINNRKIFSSDEKLMYMSGRALHPLSVNLANKLQSHFGGNLNISFSGGVDCFNVSEVLRCGIYPATICSDILKPGGYGRLKQYLDNISMMLNNENQVNFSSLLLKMTNEKKLTNLENYASKVLTDNYYKKDKFTEPNIKSGKKLNLFDCISAPCVNNCPTNQDIPEYLFHTANNQFDKAMAVILKTNPLPAICGMVCDHECQTKCTRINYDDALMIREVKRFISEQNTKVILKHATTKTLKAAIIGGGPSGLSCGFFLALSGFEVNIYETKAFAGGMVSDAIPQFRLTREAINADIERIKALGVQIHYESKIDSNTFKQLQQHNDFVYVAVGAQMSKPLDIADYSISGILDPLKFLSEIKKDNNILNGNKIAVIGGGNTAMDVARTAKRLIGNKGKVCILYRRSIIDMPAAKEEIKEALDENIEIIEYVLPVAIETKNNKLSSLTCVRMKAGIPDSDGRAKPEKIKGSEFIMEFDTLIPALGQDIVVDFLNKKLVLISPDSHLSQIPNVYFGGDALRGASNVIKAVADGRKTAAEIISRSVIEDKVTKSFAKKHDFNELMIKRSQREFRQSKTNSTKNPTTSLSTLPAEGLTKEQAIKESLRCLHCDELCNICITVCPNRANVSYKIDPVQLILQKAVLKSNNEINFYDSGKIIIEQDYQVLNIADLCNECGNCTTFCPTSGKPFKDKPRFFINGSKFRQSESGYLLSRFPNKMVFIKKSYEEIKTLTFENNLFTFETDKVTASFMGSGFELIHAKFTENDLHEFEFSEAAEMYILMDIAKKLI